MCQKHFPENTVDFNYWTNLNLTPIPKNYRGFEVPAAENLNKRKESKISSDISGPEQYVDINADNPGYVSVKISP